MFMRVWRTVPLSTMRLSRGFVNGKSSVSTGFYRFSSGFLENGRVWAYFRGFWAQKLNDDDGDKG
jgi:hypothetical protein